MDYDYIIYKIWANGGNHHEVSEFCGPQPECELCKGNGEYETEYGPAGCHACNSRCFAFTDGKGIRRFADDGDKIWKINGTLYLNDLPNG